MSKRLSVIVVSVILLLPHCAAQAYFVAEGHHSSPAVFTAAEAGSSCDGASVPDDGPEHGVRLSCCSAAIEPSLCRTVPFIAETAALYQTGRAESAPGSLSDPALRGGVIAKIRLRQNLATVIMRD